MVFAATGNTQALLPKNSPSLELTQNTLMNIKHKRVETSEPLAMVTVQKMTVCPSWGQASAFVYKQDLLDALLMAFTVTLEKLSHGLQHNTVLVKDSHTLLAGPSSVTKILIGLFYLTSRLQGFDSPV